MTPAQKTMLKKKREQMRKRLRYDIQNLIKLSEGELGEFEATHAIVDTILNNLDERVRHGQVQPILPLGLAQSYTEHTKHQADQAGDAEPAKAKPGVGSVWNKLLGKSAEAPIFFDDIPQDVAPAVEYVWAKITKNVEDWGTQTTSTFNPVTGSYKFIVGGEVGQATLDKYGYELPDGYDFIGPNEWGGYLIAKLTPEPADVDPEKTLIHLCGTKGCEQFTLYKGTQYLVSGSMVNAKGLTKKIMEGSIPDYITVYAVPSKDAYEFAYKSDYLKAKGDKFAQLYGFKTMNYFQQAKAGLKEQLSAPNPIWESISTSSKSLTEADLTQAMASAGPQDYALKNDKGKVVYVPMKKWLTMDQLAAFGVASINLPSGMQWHSHYPQGAGKYDPDQSLWWLDYLGSPKPAPPIQPLTAKLPEWTWNYGDQVQEFGDTF